MLDLTHRILLAPEIESSREYERILNEYHIKYKVRNYDRVSVHEHFPEIKQAFEHHCAVSNRTRQQLKELYERRFKNINE